MAEIDAFIQQVLADQTEWEADLTPAYALLAAGRLEEVEAVARHAVLEKENATLEIGTSVSQFG